MNLENIDWQEFGYKTEEEYLDALNDYEVQAERDREAEENDES